MHTLWLLLRLLFLAPDMETGAAPKGLAKTIPGYVLDYGMSLLKPALQPTYTL